jgi:hypothetical protein
MSINAIGGTPAIPSANQNSFPARMQQALAPVAQLFGETSDQLMSELSSSHTSLSALAASKGVSQTELVNTIKESLQQSAPGNGRPAASDIQLTNIATRIANHKHGHHHHTDAVAPDPTASAGTDPTSATPLV